MPIMKTALCSFVLALFPLALVSDARAQQPAQQPAQPPAAAAPAGEVALDLKNDVDGALRALRYAQDPETGSYGKQVETTAWVLRVMRESERHYQRLDGPFIERALQYLASKQRENGAIHDDGAQGDAIVRQTKLAAAALALHADETTKETLAKALAFIGAQTPTADVWQDPALPSSKAELKDKMLELRKQRDEQGLFDGARGKIEETARAAMQFVRATPQLKPATKPAPAAKPLPSFEPADRARALEAITRGVDFLAKAGEQGRYGEPGKPDPGMTAMALSGLLSAPEPRAAPVQAAIDAGLAWLVSLQKPDGSIHDGKLANYVTSASVMALAKSGRPEFKPVIEKASKYIVTLQLGPEDNYSEDHPYYGGIGYGSSERPDLSNMQMALEALTASGLDPSHEAFQRAKKFLERCQNRSESNDIKIPGEDGKTVVSGNDGGAAYLPGQSMAGFIELKDGTKVPRSYGSMTYALLKSYIFAGVKKDDPRMVAVWEWVQKNYTLDVNPGFEATTSSADAYQGLFYYFATMAKALDLYGTETLVDAQGNSHSWRKDLAGRLVAMQKQADGSWINENSPRWWEGNPVLATSYALITLSLAVPR
jgi:squalene-hopene/tetraprenyl-beta-curcumene cyclase